MTPPRKLCLLPLLSSTVWFSTAWGADPQLFLSWRAPYGSPRAAESVTAACGDTATADTLYLTYLTGRDSQFFVGVEATVYFRAATGDTLGPFWQFDKGSDGLHVEFNADSVPGCTRPWKGGTGFGGQVYDRTAGSGRLRLFNVLPIGQPVPVRDSTLYLLARFLLRHPPARLPRCDQPICIEWATGELVLDSTAVTKASRGGSRFVAWNSPKGPVCSPFRPQGPEPWKPKAPGSQR